MNLTEYMQNSSLPVDQMTKCRGLQTRRTCGFLEKLASLWSIVTARSSPRLNTTTAANHSLSNLEEKGQALGTLVHHLLLSDKRTCWLVTELRAVEKIIAIKHDRRRNEDGRFVIPEEKLAQVCSPRRILNSSQAE